MQTTEDRQRPRSVYLYPNQDPIVAAYLIRDDVNFSFLVRCLLRKHLAELEEPIILPEDGYGKKQRTAA